MGKKRINLKEIIMVFIYFTIIVSYEVMCKLGFVDKESLLGIILLFLLIIGITLVYLVYIQKEKSPIIANRTKKAFRKIIIPFLISSSLIIVIPYFVSMNSKLHKLFVILILGMTGIWIVILRNWEDGKKNEKKGDVVD
jgi:amino acid transporter